MSPHGIPYPPVVTGLSRHNTASDCRLLAPAASGCLKQLSRLFHKRSRRQFIRCITALRLEAAEQLLTSTPGRGTAGAQQRGCPARTRWAICLARRQYGDAARIVSVDHGGRPRARTRYDRTLPVAAGQLYALLNHTGKQDWESPPPLQPPLQARRIVLDTLPIWRRVPLRHSQLIITLRELDDLLREDVRQSLMTLHAQIPIHGIDIHEPFLSSRLFSDGWDDPQMVGYACCLQQVLLSLPVWDGGGTAPPPDHASDLLRQFYALPRSAHRQRWQAGSSSTLVATGAEVWAQQKRRSGNGRRTRSWASATAFRYR